LKDQSNLWRPRKRVEANDNLEARKKEIYKQRVMLAHASFKAYDIALRNNNFNDFIKYMDPLVRKYNKLVEPSLFKKILRKFKKGINTISRI
jgi:hypothetical protein